MRILQVRFRNLNSLVGEWDIDLTHPAFASDGIFAITGPTGSGKTTILDAICLALYGRTPRLNRVTKSGNEIMSRQTGECFAEVTFETQAGRFRCHWRQHRARKKPDGELQAPKHEIANADSGEIFESRIRGVADQVETVTGMDFDRFTRSMLLAQGGFAAFLQAAPDERAPILEQITGTEIYSQISIRVHERQREEQEKLNLLQAETAGIVILEPEQEKEIQQELLGRKKEETDLVGKSTDTEKAITWLTAIAGLKKEINGLTEEANRLQSDIDAFKPERDRLSRAARAVSLDGLYATLTVIRKQQADDQTELKIGEEALPDLEFSAWEQAESLELSEQRSIKAKEELIATASLIQQVRSLDQKLADQKKRVSEGEGNCKKDTVKMDADKQARLKEREKRAQAGNNLKISDRYLMEHAQDEWLRSGLAGVEVQLGSLLSRQEAITRKEADQEKAATALEQATKALDDCQKQCGAWKQELEGAKRNLWQGEDELNYLLDDRLLREYRTEKETLLREMAILGKIAELEEHRTKLEDGSPCPLCGAREHPFAEGNVPVPDETEKQIETLARLISKAEDQEAAIEKMTEAEVTARKNLTDAEKREATAANNKKAAGKALSGLTEGLGELRADYTELKQSVSARLQPLSITEIPDSNVSSLLESLRVRLKAWQAQVQKKTKIEKQNWKFRQRAEESGCGNRISKRCPG